MELTAILYPILTIGGIGLVFGIVLGIAAKKFAVPIDERVEEVKACLPGANCGGCGLAGCEAMAKAIVKGESKIDGCPICSKEQVEAIALIMDIKAEISERKVAVVRCQGNEALATTKYIYEGIKSCNSANLIGGGPKQCAYGCLGFGTCQEVCPFGAITMNQGLPIIRADKCRACGVCVGACPRELIHIVPITMRYEVKCLSQDKGKAVKESCKVGCLGCGICVKKCQVGAIALNHNVAAIDMEKCVACGKCKDKCPTGAIIELMRTEK